MHYYYKLNGKTPVPCKPEEVDSEKKRHVGWTELLGYKVSTVFIPFNMTLGDGPPQVFETMVFSMENYQDLYCARYSTWGAARLGHYKAILWTIFFRIKNGVLNAS